MEILHKQIARARSRLTSQLALRRCSQFLTVFFGAATIAVAVPKLWPLPIEEPTWLAAWLVGAVILSLLATIAVLFWQRPSAMHASMEIDKRFGLKERISSAAEMSEHDRNSPAGQALLMDAAVRAERIDVRDAFPIGFQRQQAWAMAPLCLAIVVFYLPAWKWSEKEVAQKSTAIDINQVKNSTQPLVEQIRKKREEAEKAGLEDAADMFRQLEDKLEKLQSDGKLDAKEAMAKLNDIKKEMQERQKQLGSGESLKKNLQQNLKKMESGPAEKMADAMQEGEFEKAEDELQKMMDKLANGEMTEQEQKKLAKQMEELEKAIEESLAQHEQAKRTLEEQLQQAQQAGDSQKAGELQKQLDAMKSMDQQMGQLAEMQDALQELQEALENGDKQAAQAAMEKMKGQMQQMKMDKEQMEQLEDMMDQLMDSKNSMTCKKCNGKGCAFCRAKQQGNPNQGMGMGEGKGSGPRDEEEDDVNTYDTQVRDKMRAGETVFKGKVGGSNRKGETKAQVQEAILSSEADDAKALEDVVLPKAQREQAKQFFDAMRQGKDKKDAKQ
jgi:hypothetical protein